MTDKELLELSAKACEYKYKNNALWDGRDVVAYSWNPLTDDGDALRLAVKLGLDVCIDKPPVVGEPYTQAIGFVGDGKEMDDAVELHNSDPYAATRRAITRAAAEIGKAK
jgi:hypothetical protein